MLDEVSIYGISYRDISIINEKDNEFDLYNNDYAFTR